jgi:hypothetical protein
MGFLPGPCVDGTRIDRFETPLQPVVRAFITPIGKQLKEKQLIRGIFVDNSLWYTLQDGDCKNPVKKQYIIVMSVA